MIVLSIIATILSYPLSLLAEALPKALLSLNRLSLQTAKLLYIVLDTFVTFWGLKQNGQGDNSLPISIYRQVELRGKMEFLGVKIVYGFIGGWNKTVNRDWEWR